MNKKIYIIRHGETEYNKLKIMQGRSINLSLNKTGTEQSNSFFSLYKDIPFELLISSELKRSQESINKFIIKGIPHIIDERITEISWGMNEGKPIDDNVKKRFKKMIEEWAKGNLKHSIPGGETGQSLYDRMDHFVNSIKLRKEKNILISTHGRALKMLIIMLLKESVSEMEKYDHANTGLYLFEQSGEKLSILKENDISHLK